MSAKKSNYFCPYCGCDGVVYMGFDNGYFDAFELVEMMYCPACDTYMEAAVALTEVVVEVEVSEDSDT